MKKFLLVAMLAVFTSSAFAQLMTGKSAAFAKEESRNWNYIYVQYNPGVFSPKEGSSKSFNALSFGWNIDFALSQSIPLYLETGIGMQWSFYSEDETYYLTTALSTKRETTFNMLSAKIPVGVGYKFDIPNAPISIVPNAGLDFRINALAESEIKVGGNSTKYDMFSSNDMGGSDYTWNRFQVGGHVGVNAIFWKKLLVGFSYQMDFSEIAKDCHVYQGNLTVGYCF